MINPGFHYKVDFGGIVEEWVADDMAHLLQQIRDAIISETMPEPNNITISFIGFVRS